MKEVLSSHDISAVVLELQKYIGTRINNIYDDTNTSKYCLKLDYKENNITKKVFLILESAKKLYIVDEFTNVRKMPGGFCGKLRKSIKNKRIEKITQVNYDRVIDFQFGTEDYAYHIIIELYASGNIILTDYNYKILNLLHTHIYNEKAKVIVGMKYPKEYAVTNIESYNVDSTQIMNWINEKIPQQKKKMTLKKFLSYSPLSVFGSYLIEHSLLSINLNPNTKIRFNIDIDIDINKIDQLIKVIKEVNETKDFKGYIILDENKKNKYFCPYLYLQYKNSDYLEYNSFLDALKIYFPYTSHKRLVNEKKIKDKINKNDKKKINIKNQINSYEKKINKQNSIIEILNLHLNDFNYILNLLKKFIKEKKYNLLELNNLINIKNDNINVKNIDFNKKTVIFNFNSMNKNVDIIINYSLNINKNIDSYFEKIKRMKLKMKNTKVIFENVKEEKGVNNHEIFNQLKEKKEHWFEKYNWFYTSHKNLVISGKTAKQNEEIYRRIEKSDIYIHSDVAGSGSCIIKGDNKEIHPRSIEEAGSFVICHTKAWKSGVPDNAWWVNPEQVSKTTQPGEYVTTGSFIIRGKKNYIKNTKLELGLGILFKNDNEPLLSGVPKNVIYAVPVCGIYSSLIDYKYKIKILPGPKKMGKMIKEIINHFNKKANSIEKKAIQNIPIDCFHRVMVNNIKPIF